MTKKATTTCGGTTIVDGFSTNKHNNNTGAISSAGAKHERRSVLLRSTTTALNNKNNGNALFTTSDDDSSKISASMNAEIDAAVSFLTYLLVKAHFSAESAELFRAALTTLLRRHYVGHWYPMDPLKGSGYRCLRVNGVMHPLLAQAADLCKLPLRKVRRAFPAELTVWVDPGDVSVRFGEEGSIGVFYAKPDENVKSVVDSSSSSNVCFTGDSSERSSVNGTPTRQHTVSPPSTNRNSPIWMYETTKTAPYLSNNSKFSSRRSNNVNGPSNWTYRTGRQTPTTTMNGSAVISMSPPSSNYVFSSEDHQIFINRSAGAGGQRRFSPLQASPPPSLVNEACKMEYQLYGNVHMGGNSANGRFTPSSLGLDGARMMEPVSA